MTIERTASKVARMVLKNGNGDVLGGGMGGNAGVDRERSRSLMINDERSGRDWWAHSIAASNEMIRHDTAESAPEPHCGY